MTAFSTPAAWFRFVVWPREAEQFLQENEKYCDAALSCLAEFDELAKGLPSDTPFSDYVSLDEFMTITEGACEKVGLSSSRFYEMKSLDDDGLLVPLLLRAADLLGYSSQLAKALEKPRDDVDEALAALVKEAIANAPRKREPE